MLPDVSGAEFLLVAAIALIVVGPKDLPMLMRKVGAFTAKMRAMAAEFRSSFDEMARQSELDDLRREVEAMRQARLADVTGLSDVQAPFTEMQGAYADPTVLDATDAPALGSPNPKRSAKPKSAVKLKAAVKPKAPRKPNSRVGPATGVKPRTRKTST